MSHATCIKRDQRRERRARVRALLQPKLPAPLLSVWQDACYVWSTFCWLFETPAQLARREALSRAEHRERNDWIHHLERLVRQLVLVAALALNLILRPSSSQTRKPRQRRLRLAWPDRPASWRARFCMMPRRRNADAERPLRGAPRDIRVVASFPLARRLEAVRRILANPDARIRRFAFTLARIAQQNARANAPRTFTLRAWDKTARNQRPGRRMIAASMQVLRPLAGSAVDRWNEAADPG